MSARVALALIAGLTLAAAAPAQAVEFRGWRITELSGSVTLSTNLATPVSCADESLYGDATSVVAAGDYRSSFSLRSVKEGVTLPLKLNPLWAGPVTIGGPVGMKLDYRRSATETIDTVTRTSTDDGGETCTVTRATCTGSSPRTVAETIGVTPVNRRGGSIRPGSRKLYLQIDWPLRTIGEHAFKGCAEGGGGLFPPSYDTDIRPTSIHRARTLNRRRATARVRFSQSFTIGGVSGTVTYNATMQIRRTKRTCFPCRDRSF